VTDLPREYHVLTKPGDASREVEDAVRQIGSEEQAGVHRHFYVARANQTVVMTIDAASPLASRLRQERGWSEPGLTSSS
jgi:hypothetical protein